MTGAGVVSAEDMMTAGKMQSFTRHPPSLWAGRRQGYTSGCYPDEFTWEGVKPRRPCPQPGLEPSELGQDFIDVAGGGRMNLDPDGFFGAAVRFQADAVVPARGVRQGGRQGSIHIDAPGERSRTTTGNMIVVHGTDCLQTRSIGLRNGVCILYGFFETQSTLPWRWPSPPHRPHGR